VKSVLCFLTVIPIVPKEYPLLVEGVTMSIESVLRHTLRKFLRWIAFAPDKAFQSPDIILDSLGFPIAVVDRRGNIICVNKWWTEAVWRTGIFGDISIEPGGNYLEACRQAAAAGIHSAGDALRGIQGVCDRSIPSYKLDYVCPSPGRERQFAMIVKPLLRRKGGAIISHREISDRRATEDVMANLSGQLINAREEERSRIARELHDNLSQKLALLSIEIEQLALILPQSVERIRAGLSKALKRVQDISAETHRLSYALHPTKLDRLGLASAAMSLCREVYSQNGLKVDCDFKDIPNDLPRDIALCLYRVIQESLQNIVKHSGACNASVELHGSLSEIRLRVTDEGVGFKPGPMVRKNAMGLLSMQERLKLVGGMISIESQPLRGTRIDATVPWSIPSLHSDSKTSESAPSNAWPRTS
jgi:signal transduction histidine kinase